MNIRYSKDYIIKELQSLKDYQVNISDNTYNNLITKKSYEGNDSYQKLKSNLNCNKKERSKNKYKDHNNYLKDTKISRNFSSTYDNLDSLSQISPNLDCNYQKYEDTFINNFLNFIFLDLFNSIF